MSTSRRALLCVALALTACGHEDGVGVPSFNKMAPEVERRYHGRSLAIWKDHDPGAPPEVRAQTAYALAALERDPMASESLLRTLLDDAHPSVRLAAVVATGRLLPPSAGAAERLVALLASPEEPIRRHARQALGRMGTVAVRPLETALADERVRVRWGAAASLGGIGPPAEAVVGALDRLVEDDPHATVRRQALFSLARLGTPGVERAIRHLSTGDLLRRNEAAAALAGGGAAAVGPLAVLLADEDAELAARAAGILADTGPPAVAARDELLRALRRSGPVRFNAAEALVAIGQPAVEALEALARSEDEGVAAVARYALGRIAGD
jgi:HEAT repeat protein